MEAFSFPAIAHGRVGSRKYFNGIDPLDDTVRAGRDPEKLAVGMSRNDL